MQVTNFRFSKQIQTAQYEPELLEAHVQLDEGEDFNKAVATVRNQITVALGRKAGKVEVAAAATEAPAVEADAVEAAPAKKKAAKKTAKKTTARKAKAVAYNREVKAHTKEMAAILNENFKGWKDDEELRARAKEVSVELTGTDFMDKEGNVLDSFVEAFTAAMNEEGEDDSEL